MKHDSNFGKKERNSGLKVYGASRIVPESSNHDVTKSRKTVLHCERVKSSSRGRNLEGHPDVVLAL